MQYNKEDSERSAKPSDESVLNTRFPKQQKA